MTTRSLRWRPTTRKRLRIKTVLVLIGILFLLNVIFLSLVSNFNMGYLAEGLLGAAFILYALVFERVPGRIHLLVLILCSIVFFLMVSLGVYGNCDNAQYDEDVVIILGQVFMASKLPCLWPGVWIRGSNTI